MRCKVCHMDFDNGEAFCPHCGAAKHYDGKTKLYDNALKSRLSLKDLFCDTFKSHPVNAMEKLLTVGTNQVPVSPQRMIRDWDKPWLYMRVLLFGLIFIALVTVLQMEGLRAGRTLMMIFPVFIMPFTVLTFFWEINIPRNISIFKVLMIFMIGGLLSIAFIMFFGHGQIPDDAAQYAAFTEEPAKLLTTALFIYFINPRFIFNGLLIGAAVGGGFGAFESLDYVVHSGESYMDQMIYRSVNIFGAHLMWAAIEGGALVMVKGSDTLSLSHFTDARFLTYLAIPMGLHFTGNYDVHLMRVPFFIDLKFLLMCGVAVYVVGILINKAIVQVLTYADKKRRPTPTNEEEIINPQSSTSRRAILTALTGPLKGKAFPFTDKVTIGRKADVCNIIFPRDTPGVSKRHCELELRSDGVYIMDTESGKGTFFLNGKRLAANKWYKVRENFYLASPDVMFSVREEEI